VVAQANTGRQPRTVVVHLEYAAPTCRAVMRPVRLARLALLAEA
jgi:hypothetical protein